MKKYYLFIVLAICFSQEIRFIDEIFEQIHISEDIVYGNAPDLPFLFIIESNTNDVDLHMDIYEPLGDTMIDRPVIIFAHSGAFFIGDKTAEDMVALSQTAAKRGYVAISMEYRLGLNILSGNSGERAVFRSVQDGSAIIRYLREYHDLYNIDPDKIFVWGSSAGAFMGLHLSYLEDSERPSSTYGSTFSPDLGCINCEGNSFNHSHKPNALISTWGGIGDLDYIDVDENVPTAFFHGTSDIVVPYSYGYPFTLNITLPQVYGSELISEKLTLSNIDNLLILENGESHEYYGATNGNFFIGGGPNEYWEQITSTAFNFLYNYLDISDDLVGDINDDNLTNIQDIVILVNFILELASPSPQEFAIADINSDNILNVLDILLIVNEITS